MRRCVDRPLGAGKRGGRRPEDRGPDGAGQRGWRRAEGRGPDGAGERGGRRLRGRGRAGPGALVVLTLLLGCPDVDLSDELVRPRPDGGAGSGDGGAPGGPGASGAARPAARLVAPPPGGVAPVDLARVALAVAAAGPVAVALEGPGGPRALAPVEGEDPVGEALCGRAAGCRAFRVDGPLAPDAAHRVVVEGLPADAALAFRTGAPEQGAPPHVEASALRADGCLVVRAVADEPVGLRLRLLGASGAEQSALGDGVAAAAVLAVPLAPPLDSDELVWLVDATDLSGHRVESAAQLEAEAPPRVTITELLPNPRGPEPASEFVELRSFAAAPVELGGLLLDDGGGRPDALPSATLLPGAYALVVPAGYDPASGADPPPAPGALLLRVDSALASGGLANGGEPLRLRLADGRVLSSYGGGLDLSATRVAGRSVLRRPEGACDEPGAFEIGEGPPTPGGPPVP